MRWARAKSRFLRPTSRTSPLPPKSLVQAQQRHPVQARERSGDDRDTAIHLVLPFVVDTAADAVETLVADGLEKTQQRFNS